MKRLIWLIIILAAILRFYRLDVLPALNADEAAIGYNSYSLIKTGNDEHGNLWPVHFQSFNDYKPGLYFYLVLPFVAFFGLNEWAVRIPGAFLGVSTVFVVWLLVKELFPDRKWLPELSAFFLTISPWHIHFSRGGWEVNVATFFITVGVWGFIKGVRDNRWFWLSSLAFVASLYTYHTARIVVPLLILGFLFIFKKALFWDSKDAVFKFLKVGVPKHFFLSVVVGVLFLVPLVRGLLGPAGVSRVAGVGLFADTGPFWLTNQQRGEHEDFQGKFALLLHNKPINYGIAFLENYAGHFWGEFLFLSGDEIQRNKVPEIGQMYLFDLLFLALGLIVIARSPKNWGVVILWIMVAPVAAALTFQSPHALRAENMVVPLTMISAYGGYWLWGKCRPSDRGKLGRLGKLCEILLVVWVLWDFSRYLHQYYFHMAKTYDYSSQYGMKELVQYITHNNSENRRVVVTNRYDQPYILFLFYLKYPPEQFQKEHVLTPRDKFGFSTVEGFGNYTFREIGNWDEIRRDYPGALIAGTEDEIPGGNILSTITFPSGRTVFKIVAN